MKDLFASDYGVTDRSFLRVGRITNPAEMIRSETVYRMLALCGTDPKKSGASSSDWELFASFCEAAELLHGHREADEILAMLRRHLSFSLPFTKENAEKLWREAVDQLSARPLSAREILPQGIAYLCDGETAQKEILEGMPVLLDGTVLCMHKDETTAALHARIRATVENFSAMGCVGVRFSLPEDFVFTPPNPYAVEEAARKSRRDAQACSLMLSQTFRELAQACSDAHLPIVLECACGTAVARLLEYTARTVGLKDLTVSAREATARDALISLAASLDLRIALSVRDVQTEGETDAALASLAARYPIGRVRILTGTDLRWSAEAQARAKERLCRFFEKSR